MTSSPLRLRVLNSNTSELNFSKSIKRRHDYKSNETKQNQLPAAQQLDRHFVLFSVILPNVVTPKKQEKIHDKKFI
jgi:hypothetical protein